MLDKTMDALILNIPKRPCECSFSLWTHSDWNTYPDPFVVVYSGQCVPVLACDLIRAFFYWRDWALRFSFALSLISVFLHAFRPMLCAVDNHNYDVVYNDNVNGSAMVYATMCEWTDMNELLSIAQDQMKIGTDFCESTGKLIKRENK